MSEPLLRGTMQDAPLLISGILRRGSDYHAGSEVTSVLDADASLERGTFAEVGARAAQLAHALRKLGVGDGDRVATLCWNHQTHLENYLAVPSMGAVLHTLNLRLFPEQLAYVINHAQDDVIVVDASLVHLLTSVWDQLTTVRRVIVIGRGERDPVRRHRLRGPHRRRADQLRLADLRGDPRGVDVLHERDNGQPEGCRLYAPFDRPARHERDVGVHLQPHPDTTAS